MSDEMIKSMNRLAEAMEAHAAAMRLSKAPAIWHIEDVAKWIGRSYEHTRDRVVKMESFPKEIPSGGWLSDEVIEWARVNKGRIAASR